MLRSDAFIPRIRTNDPAVFELSFSGRRPTGPTLRILGDSLKQNNSLKRLDLSNCHLTDEDVTPLLQLLEFNKGVTHLSLANNPELGDATTTALRRCILGSNSTLSFVELEGTGTSRDCQQDLTFIISLNKFPTQLKQQAHRARNNEENFFTFELSHDTTDPKIYNEESARLVATSLAHNTVIRTLKMNRCCVGEHSLRELRYLFQVNTTLRRVALQENFLGSESAVMIATAIGKAGAQSSIQDIDLSINEIDDEGCDAFTQLLEENTTIRVVSLLRNRCSQVALDRLRTACALNCEPAELKPLLPRLQHDEPSITSIVLPGTSDVAARGPGRGYFTSLGAATISEALLHNTHVHTILLPGNHIGADGAKALAALIARTTSLTAIDISRNPINDEGARHLVLGLRQNDSLVELRMDGCNVSSKAMSEASALCHLNVQPLPIKQLLAKGVEGTDADDPLRAGVLHLAYRAQQPPGKWKSLHSESMPYVLTILKKLPHIHELDLCDNASMGDASVMQLIAFIRDPVCRLRKVLLCNTGITDVTLNALAEAIVVNYSIQSVVATPNAATSTRPQQRLEEAVQHNQFPAAVKDLILPLQKNVQGIEEIHFVRTLPSSTTNSSAPIEQPFGDDAVRVLTAALHHNTRVTRFVYSGQRMSNRGMGYVAELLLHNTTITEVDVSNNDVGPDGVEDLANMLEQNVTLTSLNVASNPMTEVGGAKLLNALQTANRALQHICVDNCRLLDATKRRVEAQVGANTQPAMFRSILENISGTSAVKFIGDASVGFLDAASVRALSLALQCAPSAAHVRSIELPHNHLGDDGLKAFVELAGTLPNLAKVDIFDNDIQHATAIPLLRELCLKSPKLTSLRAFTPSVQASDPALQEIEDLLLLHDECVAFQATFVRLQSVLSHQLSSSSSMALSARLAAGPTTVIDIADSPLSCVSFQLLDRLLQRASLPNCANNIRGLSLQRCSLDHTAVIGGLVPLLKSCTRLAGLQLRDVTTLSTTDAAALLQVIDETSSLLQVDVDAQALPTEDTSDAVKAIVDAHRHTAAVTAVENIFATTQQLTNAAVSRVPSQKARSSAAGRPAVAVRSLEEESAVLSDIMKDALQQMPPRTAYQRGMYASSR